MEYWDLRDEFGNKLSKKITRSQEINENEFHLVVHIIIKNSSDQYLIQKRSPSKDMWPNLWAFTGGAVLADEISEDGALRELKEEIGIIFKKNELKYLSRLIYKNAISDIWFIKADIDLDTLTFQEEEVSALDFKSKEEIKLMINNNKFYRYEDDYFDIVFK